MSPITCRNCVIMKRNAVRLVLNLVHNLFCPMIITAVRTAGNSFYRFVGAVFSDIGVVSFEKTAVIFGIHFAAASPTFISDAEVCNCPRFFMTVLSAKLCHGRNTVEGHIFNPLTHFFNCTRTDISVNICITSELTAKLEILVSAKGIILDNATPMSVNHFLTVFFRSYAVFPMIFIGKAATGPTENRNSHFL